MNAVESSYPTYSVRMDSENQCIERSKYNCGLLRDIAVNSIQTLDIIKKEAEEIVDELSETQQQSKNDKVELEEITFLKVKVENIMHDEIEIKDEHDEEPEQNTYRNVGIDCAEMQNCEMPFNCHQRDYKSNQSRNVDTVKKEAAETLDTASEKQHQWENIEVKLEEHSSSRKVKFENIMHDEIHIKDEEPEQNTCTNVVINSV